MCVCVCVCVCMCVCVCVCILSGCFKLRGVYFHVFSPLVQGWCLLLWSGHKAMSSLYHTGSSRKLRCSCMKLRLTLSIQRFASLLYQTAHVLFIAVTTTPTSLPHYYHFIPPSYYTTCTLPSSLPHPHHPPHYHTHHPTTTPTPLLTTTPSLPRPPHPHYHAHHPPHYHAHHPPHYHVHHLLTTTPTPPSSIPPPHYHAHHPPHYHVHHPPHYHTLTTTPSPLSSLPHPHHPPHYCSLLPRCPLSPPL